MDDFRHIIIEELKAINRKLERLDDSMDAKIRQMEHEVQDELTPIKAHVAQVRLIGVLISIAAPLILGIFTIIL